MNFANPVGFALAALAIPIIIFYILKVRLRRVPVSTLMFWRQIFEEKKPRSIWQRLRHLISLALQLAFLAFLFFALADPIFRWQQQQARRLVVVVDNSASMNATDVKPTRLATAKAEALRLIGGLRLGDEMAIISAGTQPEVASGFTDHQRTLRDAVDAIVASEGPTRVTDAVALGKRLVSGSDKAHTIVVLSDAAFDDVAQLERSPDVAVVPIGTRAGNIAITRLQARRSLLDPIGYEILVEVQNASDNPATGRLELELDESPIDVVPLELKPGEHITRIFEKTSADGGRLRAAVTAADALATDNVAWAILPKREPRKLTLVTEGNLFLEKVFEAIPLVDLSITKQPTANSVPKPAVWVFHRKLPSKLPAGPILVIEPTTDTDYWKVDAPIQNPVVAKLDKESELLAHVRLDQVVMPEARRLTLNAPTQVLAETASGEPLYALIDRPEGKIAVLTVNLDQGDLPLQTAFPIMMANLLGWFSEGKGELRESHATGDIATVDVPEAEGNIVLRGPDGKDRPIAGGSRKVTVGPLDRVGIWSILRQEKPSATEKSPTETVLAQVACNLTDRRESDLRPPEGGLAPQTRDLAGGLGGRPIWFYLLAFAAFMTCLEWFLYQRRWID